MVNKVFHLQLKLSALDRPDATEPHQQRRIQQLASLVLAFSVVASPLAMADPSVNGQVISWPDDGWYQVQSVDGATTLCNGGSSCTVPPGEYLVINHTLGIRYTSVSVGEEAGSDIIQVNGQVISWPDFGWFQVQSTDGLVTYCNGGRSCTVEPGTYLVIDHTTGQRFENIVVGDTPAVSNIIVEGQRISWPDDGWYQVQTADGSTSLCNGGSYCDVEPGTYLVINHTTGVRFTGIEVGDDTLTTAIINRDNHIELLNQVFSVYTGSIYEDTLPGIPEDFMDSHESIEVDVPEDIASEHSNVTRLQYACDNGGVLEYTVGYGSYENTDKTFDWDNCLDGDVIRNGTLNSWAYEYGGYYRDLITSTYDAEYGNGDSVALDGVFGNIAESHINPNIRRIERWINQDFNYTMNSGLLELIISNAGTDTAYYWTEGSPSTFSASLNGSFQLNSALTGHQDMDVETSEALTSSISVDSFSQDGSYVSEEDVDYPAWDFTEGVLELSAEDGSALRLEADSGDEQTAQITLLQDGVELETFQQPWSLWTELLEDVQADPRD